MTGTKIRTRWAFVAAVIAALAIALAVCIATPQKAYAYGIKQTSATANSITFAWDDPNGSSTYCITKGYKVSWGSDYKNIKKTITLPANQRSYTIKGLKAGSEYYVKLEYDYYYPSSGNSYTSQCGSNNMTTRVVKPTGVKQTKWWYYAESVDAAWNIQQAADKVQYKVINTKTGKSVKNETLNYRATTLSCNKVKNNTVYYMQVRVHDKYGWSAWSDKAYLFTQPMAIAKSTYATTGKLKVTWGKIAGATSYTVYASTKEKSGYKKIGTVSSKKNTITTSKVAGKKVSKNKTYYVYVVANKKVGGKTYTSGRHYSYQVKGTKGTLKWTFD